jgi:carbon monoxide dehydrogenase subunit G
VEIEKTLTVAASPQRVWALLLDPQVMGGCVPGMKSIDVVSDVEYVALMHVKIAFINARFKLRTTIVEQREPSYLRAEGTGEDASVASSLKQQSEIFLMPTAEGGTELRIKVQVDVLGRLGTFGLSVMKTKADRMWEEFGANLAARIDGGVSPAPVVEAPAPPAPAVAAAPAPAAAAAKPAPAIAAKPIAKAAESQPSRNEPTWWSRLTGNRPNRSASLAGPGRFIRIEVRQPDRTISVDWPIEGADQCQAWLRDLLK